MTVIRNYLPAGPIVLDASAIISILGCGVPESVFEALPDGCVIEERTLGELVRHPIRGLSHTEIVERLHANGHLKTVRMDSAEYNVFLSLIQGETSGRLGVGESAAIAIAVTRRYGIILDEAKARRIFAARDDCTEYTSTLKLLFSVAFHRSLAIEHLSKMVGEAIKHSRLGVPKDDRHLLSVLPVLAECTPALEFATKNC